MTGLLHVARRLVELCVQLERVSGDVRDMRILVQARQMLAAIETRACEMKK